MNNQQLAPTQSLVTIPPNSPPTPAGTPTIAADMAPTLQNVWTLAVPATSVQNLSVATGPLNTPQTDRSIEDAGSTPYRSDPNVTTRRTIPTGSRRPLHVSSSSSDDENSLEPPRRRRRLLAPPTNRRRRAVVIDTDEVDVVIPESTPPRRNLIPRSAARRPVRSVSNELRRIVNNAGRPARRQQKIETTQLAIALVDDEKIREILQDCKNHADSKFRTVVGTSQEPIELLSPPNVARMRDTELEETQTAAMNLLRNGEMNGEEAEGILNRIRIVRDNVQRELDQIEQDEKALEELKKKTTTVEQKLKMIMKILE